MRFPARRCPQRAFLAQAAGSNFHPAGSCAMGIGSDAVVAPDLTVDGIEGLRVVDASVISTIVCQHDTRGDHDRREGGPTSSAGREGHHERRSRVLPAARG